MGLNPGYYITRIHYKPDMSPSPRYNQVSPVNTCFYCLNNTINVMSCMFLIKKKLTPPNIDTSEVMLGVSENVKKYIYRERGLYLVRLPTKMPCKQTTTRLNAGDWIVM